MDKKIIALFSISFLALVVAYALNRRSFNEMREFMYVVNKAQTAAITFEQVSKHLKTAEVYARLLEKEPDQAASSSYVSEIGKIREGISQLRAMAVLDVQRKRMDSIFHLMNMPVHWVLKKNDTSRSQTAVGSDYIQHLTQVDSISRRAILYARNTLSERRSQLQQSVASIDFWTLILSCISVIFILFSLSYSVLQIFKRNKTESFLESVLNASLNVIIHYKAIRSSYDRRIIDFNIKYTKGELPFHQADQSQHNPATFLALYPNAISNGEFERMVHVVDTGETRLYEINYGEPLHPRWFKVKLVKKEDGLTASFINISDIKESQEQLEIHIKRLEQSNNELEQFASVASHDLQEPLRKIQTFSDTLSKKDEIKQDESSLQLTSRIINASERMRNLIDALLNFSRITNTEERFEPVHLDKVLENVLKDFELMIYEKKAVIEVMSLPVITGNALQLNQLFFNLVNNALKFNQEGVTPYVRITYEYMNGVMVHEEFGLSPSVNYIRIAIADNGIGFDKIYAKDIFVIFKRLHNREAYAGSGIGLALCKKIVNSHRGDIYVDAEEGVGATFYIVLPVEQHS